MQRYDAIIIGTGPAGLEAAVNLKIREKKFLLFGKKDLSQKLTAAPKINNYLGFPDITGLELQKRFLSHLDKMDIEILEKHVSMVYPMGNYFSLATATETIESTAVILATGTFAGKLYDGEQQFLGHGVGYCATCDAPLYRGKAVAILGYGDESVHEANFVAELAETVYYIPVKKSTVALSGKIKVVDKKVLEIVGEKKVTGLKLADEALEVDGVFVLRETIAPDSLVPGLQLEDGFIKVDSQMRTSYPGLFAAGDCTGKPHQYMRAAGQGQTAALMAVQYIDTLNAEKKGQ